METKRCTKCKQDLELKMFYKTPTGKDGLRGDCKDCAWKQRKAQIASKDPAEWTAHRRPIILKNKYGITEEVYDRILAYQNGACAICLRVVDYMLHVDHNHDTGEVRGLLCRGCNSGMGMLGDNVDRLQRAIEYLRR